MLLYHAFIAAVPPPPPPPRAPRHCLPHRAPRARAQGSNSGFCAKGCARLLLQLVINEISSSAPQALQAVKLLAQYHGKKLSTVRSLPCVPRRAYTAHRTRASAARCTMQPC